MKKTTAIIAGLSIFGLTAFPVLAAQQEADTEYSKVEFSNLSQVNGDADDGTCKTRYDNGYSTTYKGKSSEGHTQLESDKGHDILITETDEVVGEGIYTITNTLAVIFPDSEDKTPVEVTTFASGLVGSNSVTGVFSDGTCRGDVTIQYTDKS